MNVNNTAILAVVITPGGIVMDGFILLLIFVIVFAAIMLLTTYSKRNCEYDERQLAIRAEAWYKTSDMARFFVGEHVGSIVFTK